MIPKSLLTSRSGDPTKPMRGSNKIPGRSNRLEEMEDPSSGEKETEKEENGKMILKVRSIVYMKGQARHIPWLLAHFRTVYSIMRS